MQLFERRTKYAVGREVPVMQALNEKFMSDEETDSEDSNSLRKRTPRWRSERLNKLIQKIDKRYTISREKENSKPLKIRKTGTPSERLMPACAPHWATMTNLEDGPVSNSSSGSEELIDNPGASLVTSNTSYAVVTPRCSISSTPVAPLVTVLYLLHLLLVTELYLLHLLLVAALYLLQLLLVIALHLLQQFQTVMVIILLIRMQ